MFESRSFVKSGIIFLSIALLVNSVFSLALFSTMQVRTHHSISLPDYDSGWVAISKGAKKIFTHNLSTTDVLVYMIGKYDDSSPYIHQIDYGGLMDNYGNVLGAYWADLTTTTIAVQRRSDDLKWNYVRVMIWKIEAGAVGGQYIPVDKFSLLAPYIALVSTIVLAISASVAYIKYRKKR